MEDFIESLKGKNYKEGLLLLLKRTIDNDEGGWFANTALVTGNVELDYNSIFTIKLIGTDNIYFRYDAASKKTVQPKKPWSCYANLKSYPNLSKELTNCAIHFAFGHINGDNTREC